MLKIQNTQSAWNSKGGRRGRQVEAVDERTCRNSKDPRRFAHALLVLHRLMVVEAGQHQRKERSTPNDQCPIDLNRSEEGDEDTDDDIELENVIPLDECTQECELLGEELKTEQNAKHINGSVDPCNCGGSCKCQFFSQSNEFYSQPDSGPSNEPEKCKPSTSSNPDTDCSIEPEKCKPSTSANADTDCSIEPEKCKPSTSHHMFMDEWDLLHKQTFELDLILEDEYFKSSGNVELAEAAQRILAQEEEITKEEFLAELEQFAEDPAVLNLFRKMLGLKQIYGMSPQPPCAGATGNVLQDMVPNAETVEPDEPSWEITGPDPDTSMGEPCGSWCRKRHRWCAHSVNLWKNNWSRSVHPEWPFGRNFLLEDSTGGGFMNIHWDNITQYLGPRLIKRIYAHFKLVRFPGPQPTCYWKWVGSTIPLKQEKILTLREG